MGMCEWVSDHHRCTVPTPRMKRLWYGRAIRSISKRLVNHCRIRANPLGLRIHANCESASRVVTLYHVSQKKLRARPSLFSAIGTISMCTDQQTIINSLHQVQLQVAKLFSKVRTDSVGWGNSILRSMRPGRSKAGSRQSIRLVAISTCAEKVKSQIVFAI